MLAEQSSKSTPEQERDASVAASTSHAADSADVVQGETDLTDALFAAEKAKAEEPDADAPAEDIAPEIVDENAAEPAPSAPPEPPAATATPAPPAAARSGPGLVPLLLGGVVVAGLGYGAAYMGLLGQQDDTQSAEIAAALQAQSEALSTLQSQVTTLGEAKPEAPEIDLSPVMTELSNLATRLDGTSDALTAMSERITDLEDRPVLTGDVDEDSAAMAAAMEILQNELGEQQATNEALAAEMRAIVEDAQSSIAEAERQTEETVAAALAEAEASVAAATAEAEASVSAATAQAAISRVRSALAAGDPFADALSDLPDTIEVPDSLQAAADTGVATLATLQSEFPAAARAALRTGLREASAEGSAGDRALAFLRGQFAGRAIAPMEGDDPDAVLSRAQAAVSAGDIDTALAEIASLPEAAQADLADWTAAAQARTEANSALAALVAALDGTN